MDFCLCECITAELDAFMHPSSLYDPKQLTMRAQGWKMESFIFVFLMDFVFVFMSEGSELTTRYPDFFYIYLLQEFMHTLTLRRASIPKGRLLFLILCCSEHFTTDKLY